MFFLGERRCLSVMFEAGSKVNWAALECGAVDKVFLYYAPKILGGLESLPMAGGTGRMRRADAIRLERTTLHQIPPDEFAVEAWVSQETDVHRHHRRTGCRGSSGPARCRCATIGPLHARSFRSDARRQYRGERRLPDRCGYPSRWFFRRSCAGNAGAQQSGRPRAG